MIGSVGCGWSTTSVSWSTSSMGSPSQLLASPEDRIDSAAASQAWPTVFVAVRHRLLNPVARGGDCSCGDREEQISVDAAEVVEPESFEVRAPGLDVVDRQAGAAGYEAGDETDQPGAVSLRVVAAVKEGDDLAAGDGEPGLGEQPVQPAR